MKLTKRQKEILDYIREFIEREGYSPSMEEIAGHFQFASLNAVFKHLEALQGRGYLHRDPNRARSIEVAGMGAPACTNVPLLGLIAAGRPIDAVNAPETLGIPAEMLPARGSCYVLKVQGNSMIGEHIADGDYVIVDAREDARDGETVVALIDGENVTLKKLYREGSQVRLQPANAALEPIMVDAERVRIQGVVTGVMRKYH